MFSHFLSLSLTFSHFVFATLCRTVRSNESELDTQNEQLRKAVQAEHTARTRSDVVAWGKVQERCRYGVSILCSLRSIAPHIIDRSSRVACFHVRDDRSSLTCQLQKSVMRSDRSLLTVDHPSRV
eukprot:COSAG02_NODE_611_length_19555_cov_34.449270_5_plen_125_part_00